MGYYLGAAIQPMGEGAYLSSEAVMEKTVDKNMHCEDLVRMLRSGASATKEV